MNQPATPTTNDKLPFGPEWQNALAFLLIEDERFADTIAPHIRREFFEHEVCQWLHATAAEHRRRYNVAPTWPALEESVRKLDPRSRPLFELGLSHIRQTPGNMAEWVRSSAIEWVRRNVFVRAFQAVKEIYKAGDLDRAVGHLLKELDRFNEIEAHPEPIQETWLFDDLAKRQAQRWQKQAINTITPTGIPQLDEMLGGGLDLGQIGIVMAYSGVGKALADNEPVLTPVGWKPIASLKVGDAVIGGSTGKPQRVLGVFPQGERDVYRVRFSDGAEVLADGDHIWTVETLKTAQRVTGNWIQLTTKQILDLPDYEKKPRIPVVPPIDGGLGKPESLDPYLLGLLIGDGSFGRTVKFHKPERDLWDVIRARVPSEDRVVEQTATRGDMWLAITRTGEQAGKTACPYGHRLEGDNLMITKAGRACRECGRTRSREYARAKRGVDVTPNPKAVLCSKTAQELYRLGLMGCPANAKFVPDIFKWADAETRFAVLSGLCDTDGSVTHSGQSIEFSSASRQLAEDVVFLVRSLGGIASTVAKVVNGRTYWRVILLFPDGRMPVRSQKNRAKVKPRTRLAPRRIESIEPAGRSSCTCIAVDDPERLFVTRDFVVTHNTTSLINFGRVAVRATLRNVAHFFFEGSLEQITNRYDAAFSQELYAAVKRGDFGSEKYRHLYAEYEHYKRKLYVRGFTDKWHYTVEDVWEAIERLRKQAGWTPDVVILDYADLLHGRGNFDSEYDSNAAAYRDVKTLSTRGRGFAIWTAAQAKKPKDDSFDTKAHLLKSPDLGGRYEKVKVADLLLSINATLQERQAPLGQLRIWVEKVRDNPAGQEIVVPCDFARMIFGVGAHAGVPRLTNDLRQPPNAGAAQAAPVLGYHVAPPPWTPGV